MSARRGRIDEDEDSNDAEDQSGDDHRPRPRSTGPDPIDENEPEGQDGDEQSGETRGHRLLRPDDGAVSADEKKCAGDERISPMLPRRNGGAALSAPKVENRSGGD